MTATDVQQSLFEEQIASAGLSELFQSKPPTSPQELVGMRLLNRTDISRNNPAIHLRYVNGQPLLSSLQIWDAMNAVAKRQLETHYTPEQISEFVRQAGVYALKSTEVTEVFSNVSFSCPLSWLRSMSGFSNNTGKFRESVKRLADVRIQVNAMGDTFLNSDEQLREFLTQPVVNLTFLPEGRVRWAYDPIMFFVEFSGHFSFTKLELPILSSIKNLSAFLLYRNCARYRNMKGRVIFTRRLPLEDWALMLQGAGSSYRNEDGELDAAQFQRRVVKASCIHLCKSETVDIAVAPVYDILGELKFGVIKKRELSPRKYEPVDFDQWKQFVDEVASGAGGSRSFFPTQPDSGQLLLETEPAAPLAEKHPVARLESCAKPTFHFLEEDSGINQESQFDTAAEQADEIPVFRLGSGGAKVVSASKIESAQAAVATKEENVEKGGAEKNGDVGSNRLLEKMMDAGLYKDSSIEWINTHGAVKVESAFLAAKFKVGMMQNVRNPAGLLFAEVKNLLNGNTAPVPGASPPGSNPDGQESKHAAALSRAIHGSAHEQEQLSLLKQYSGILAGLAPSLILSLMRASVAAPKPGAMLPTRLKNLSLPEAKLSGPDFLCLAQILMIESNVDYLLNDSACESILLKITQLCNQSGLPPLVKGS